MFFVSQSVYYNIGIIIDVHIVWTIDISTIWDNDGRMMQPVENFLREYLFV